MAGAAEKLLLTHMVVPLPYQLRGTSAWELVEAGGSQEPSRIGVLERSSLPFSPRAVFTREKEAHQCLHISLEVVRKDS